MRTIRRLYLYAVAFVSLEGVIWGTTWLARSMFCSANALCPGASILAEGLAYILVSLPVFGIHWGLAQRLANRDEEESSSAMRALFLYGVLLATLIPIVQNALALLDRLALQAVGLSPMQAFIGSSQTWSDNLVAMLMNAIAAAYFLLMLKNDWQKLENPDTYALMRRIYRHVWLLYSLVMVIAAVQQLLRFILSVYPDTFADLYRASGAHGVVLALLGVPLWLYWWWEIRQALMEKEENASRLHLGVLYLLSLAGVITVLVSAGVLVNTLLQRLLGESLTFAGLLEKISPPVSILIPLAGVWAYYGRRLGVAIADTPDASQRAGMRRLYLYILSAIGLAAALSGLSMLLTFVIDAALGRFVGTDVLRTRLTAALALLLVSLPLWLQTWRPLQEESLQEGDAGDHARRSLIRKVYLYLVLFSAVVGGMVAAAGLFTMLLRTLFGGNPGDFIRSLLQDLANLLLFAGLGAYHGLLLGRDGKLASLALAGKHASFPVMILDNADGSFGRVMTAAMKKQVPNLPAIIHPAGKVLPTGNKMKAVLLPLDLALDPPEPLRNGLGKFNGVRLVVPHLDEDKKSAWLYTGGLGSMAESANQAVQTLRQLAEGQEVHPRPAHPGWMVIIYILAGISGVELLLAVISLGISLIAR